MKNKEASELWKKLEKSSGDEQKKIFISYCKKLIELKEKGEMREEDAAYGMVGAIRFDSLTSDPQLQVILDAAGDTELAREHSYDPAVKWDQKTADALKGKQWKGLVQAVKLAEGEFLL